MCVALTTNHEPRTAKKKKALFFPKALDVCRIPAGLLTYSFSETSFPFLAEQWLEYRSKIVAELTAAGLSGIFTRFPFQCLPRTGKYTTRMSEAKIE
jgi:hypothetical protein